LFNVFVNFGSDVIGDIDDDVEELLLKETDLSTKRNAFLLLNRSNPEKALKYLEQQINFQAVE
jgi:coatomer subunit beta